jgi:hypothetical protein
MIETAMRANRAFWIVLTLAVAALLGTIYVPAVAAVFRFSPLGGATLAAACAAGFASVLWYDVLKLLSRKPGPKAEHGGQGERTGETEKTVT